MLMDFAELACLHYPGPMVSMGSDLTIALSSMQHYSSTPCAAADRAPLEVGHASRRRLAAAFVVLSETGDF